MRPKSQRGPLLRWPASVAPLSHPAFAQYWVGFAVTNAGKWIEQTGTVWLVYALTSSPFLLGLLGIARAVPAVILGPVAGVVVDRTDQRRLLLVTQGLGLVASLALGLLVVSRQVQLWHIYLQVAVQSGITAFDAPVRQALFPRLVPRAQLAEAVTLTFSAGKSAAFIGPVIGGFAIANLGEGAPFLLNAGTFLVLMTAVAGMGGVNAIEDPMRSSFRGELVEGLRHIVRTPVLAGLFKLEIAFSIFAMNAVIITVLGREVLGVGAEGLGGLLSAEAMGSLIGIGSLLVGRQTRRPGRFNILCTLGYAGTLVAFALSRSFVLTFLCLAVSGFFDSLISVTRSSVLQLAAPAGMRGRVMANLGTVTRGVGPLGQTQSGVLAGAFGGTTAVLGSALILAANAVITMRGNATLWRFCRLDQDVVKTVDAEIERLAP